MVRPSKMMHNYATKQPFVRRAASVILGSKPPLAAIAHRKNWVEAPSVRFLQFFNSVCDRSEGPVS